MKKSVLLVAAFLALGAAPAMAANCTPYTYTLTNGTTADGSQVMSNFNTILACGNNQLLGKSNNLSDVQSAPTARTNLGLGTGSTVNITSSNSPPSGTANAGDIWIQW